MLEFFRGCFDPRQRQQQQRHSTSTQTTDRSSVEEFQEASAGLGRRFPLQELQTATSHFHPNNRLGGGGFGAVYKGVLADGTEVAVKQLSAQSRQGKREFLNEVQLLSTVQHINLVRLFGCCAEGAERLLVYEYLPNGSLDQSLFRTGSKFLEWSVRREIIMGAAKGLKYLHEDSRLHIVHRDMKASNILLDDKFHAKIADFGLARLFEMKQTHASTRVAGTFGYIAPEYASSGKLTDKADVYSFGVVMLEVVSGRRHTNLDLRSKYQRLVEVAWRLHKKDKLLDLVDPKLGDQYVPWEAARILHVALLCIQAAPNLRPSMSRVVYLLSGRSTISEMPMEPLLIYNEGLRKRPHKSRSHERPSSATSNSSTAASRSSLFS